MNIITGYLSPTEGSVTVDGFDTLENPMEAKKRIGYLPEIPASVYGHDGQGIPELSCTT